MDDPIGMVIRFGDRITGNFRQAVSNLTLEKAIRLVIIVGAYLLLRPYMIKLAGKTQMQQHEKEEAATQEAMAKLSPNSIRGKVEIPDDSDSDEDAPAQASSSDWGKKARRRQRNMLKKLMDDHERKLALEQEDEEDKDIEEFLEK